MKNLEQALQNIKKGVFTTEEHKRQIPLKKGFEHLKVEKQTKSVVRLGCKYANLQEIKIKNIETNSLSKNLEWIKEYEDILMINQETKEISIRLTKSRNSKHKAKTKWFLNGLETTKEELIKLGCLYAKDINSSNYDSPVFNVKVKDLISLGGYC